MSDTRQPFRPGVGTRIKPVWMIVGFCLVALWVENLSEAVLVVGFFILCGLALCVGRLDSLGDNLTSRLDSLGDNLKVLGTPERGHLRDIKIIAEDSRTSLGVIETELTKARHTVRSNENL